MAVAPRIGAFIVNNSLPCSVWPVPPEPPAGRLTAAGRTADPRGRHHRATPPPRSRRRKALARQLDKGRLLVADGEQHTAFGQGNRCVDDAVTRYLVGRRVPRAGTRC